MQQWVPWLIFIASSAIAIVLTLVATKRHSNLGLGDSAIQTSGAIDDSSQPVSAASANFPAKIESRLQQVVRQEERNDLNTRDLEELLLTTGMSLQTARALLATDKGGHDLNVSAPPRQLAAKLAENIEKRCRAVQVPFLPDLHSRSSDDAPLLVLITGINGVGKTTSIGKLAKLLVASGHSVSLAAGDTFRTAAIEQLQKLGERIGVPVVSQKSGADPAAVMRDALTSAAAAKEQMS